MRLLVINYEFPPIGGGGSKASLELARRLVRRGHRVDVLTAGDRQAPSVSIEDGITVHRTWSWRKSIHECGLRGAFTFLLSALPRLRRILKADRYDATVYFFGFPTGLLSYYSWRVAGVPYIVSLRGSDVPMYDRGSPRLRLLHRLLRPVTRDIWRNAAQVTAVSHGLADLAKMSFPDIDIEVIHNGIEPQPGRAGSGAAQRNSARLRINCVARLIPRKGIGQLIDAVAMLRRTDLEIHIVGTGPAEQDLRQLAQSRGVADCTFFHGYQNPEAIAELNRQADMFVLPTYSEAFANVILEAMGAGLPVIATRVGGIPEAVIDTVTGILVEPKENKTLAAAIERLADNPELREAMGAAGLARVRQRFSWDINVDAYEQLLKTKIIHNAEASYTTGH